MLFMCDIFQCKKKNTYCVQFWPDFCAVTVFTFSFMHNLDSKWSSWQCRLLQGLAAVTGDRRHLLTCKKIVGCNKLGSIVKEARKLFLSHSLQKWKELGLQVLPWRDKKMLGRLSDQAKDPRDYTLSAFLFQLLNHFAKLIADTYC